MQSRGFARCLQVLMLVTVLCLAKAKEEELKVTVLSIPEGCDQKSKSGDMLTMHYIGTLADGTKFDSSRKNEEG
ncbi:hypothetical protein J437_LFUL000437 [Ladona fulva]|uniref:peptidylprolyl isomerase n=1 Tax=Ladona fulva TaxID=123851 RepID=A0A8K0K7M7_LADFU|nr:hypothetical protein J437_LFUL000437 [Ladona fulva]